MFGEFGVEASKQIPCPSVYLVITNQNQRMISWSPAKAQHLIEFDFKRTCDRGDGLAHTTDDLNDFFRHDHRAAEKEQGDVQVTNRAQSAMHSQRLAKGASELDDCPRRAVVREDGEEHVVFRQRRARGFEE